MKNWQKVARYAREISVALDLYLDKNVTTREQMKTALFMLQKSIKADFTNGVIDIIGYSLVNTQISEIINDTYSFGYYAVVQAIEEAEPINTFAEYRAMSNFFHKLEEEVSADGMSKEDKDEWADKFFSVL